jgi:hypothetical protein
MKKIIQIFLIVFVSLSAYSQPTDTIFINPAASGSSESGTRANPWVDFKNSSDRIDDRCYAIKGGTTLNITTAIDFGGNIKVDNIEITSYDTTGVGIAEIYKSTTGSGVFDIWADNTSSVDTTIRFYLSDLSIYHTGRSTLDGSGETVTILLHGGIAYIDNVHVVGGQKAFDVTAYYARTEAVQNNVKCDLYMTNCTSDSTWDDGAYLCQLRNIYVDNCYFRNIAVSQYDFDYSEPDPHEPGGDCLQTWEFRKLEVNRCTFDRSSTIGKFALITTDCEDYVKVDSSVLIGTMMYDVSIHDDSVTQAIFKGNSPPDGWHITNSIVSNSVRGFQNWGYNLEIDNCLFKNVNIVSNNAVTFHPNLTNSTIIANSDKGRSTYNTIMYFSGTNTGFEARNNIFYGNDNFVLHPGNPLGATDIDYNNWYNQGVDNSSYYGANAQTVDPQFEETTYYTLSSSSPLLTSGEGGRQVGWNIQQPSDIGYDGSYTAVADPPDEPQSPGDKAKRLKPSGKPLRFDGHYIKR